MIASLQQPLRALYDPIAGVSQAVSQRRWAFPLTLLMAAVVFAGVGFAARWDATSAVLMELGDQLAKTSEVDIAQAVQTKERIVLVTGVATGLFATPLVVLLLAVATKVLLWLLGRSARF